MICSAGEIWGGVEQFILTLTTGLRARGVSQAVLLFHDGRLAECLRAEGIAVDVLKSRHPYDPRQVVELRDALLRHRATVVHAHGYKAMVTSALAVRHRLTRAIRLIKTEHGQLEAPSSWKAVPAYLRLGANVAVDIAASRWAAHRIVYVSRDTQRVRSRWLGRGEVIYNGIPGTPDGAPLPAARSEGPFTVGIVGRLTAVKGHEFLFRALNSLPAVRLRVLGTGPDESALRALAVDLGIADRVDFAGFVSPILPAIAALDVLAMPSLHEGLPYALLEAMLVGTPVVASRVGGLAEALEDGVSGVLIRPRDPAGLAAAIDGLERDPVRRRTIAESARVRVTTTFNAERMIDAYLGAYARLAA